MITITRRQVRHLRGVVRRHTLGIAHRGRVPPIVFRTGDSQLRVRHQYGVLAVEYAEPSDQPDGAIAVPLDALAEFEGRDQSAVVLDAPAADRTAVRWVDGGVPQLREYDVMSLEKLALFPEATAEWTTGPAELLSVLAEASATTSEDSTRYALNCMQLRGKAGEVAATDGRQLLIRGGLTFPWRVDLLVRRSPIFGSRELSRDRAVMISRTDSHIALRIGAWTLYLEVQAEGRFPVLGHVVPEPHATATRLRLDPQDIAFLVPALERLPGVDEPFAPATLDLNGKVAVRARGSDHAQLTELVLTRSTYTGTPVRLNTDRHVLARALRLGLTEIEIVDPDSPVVARGGDRTYCWQPLSKDSALEPTEDVTRIESGRGTKPLPDRTAPQIKAGTTVRQRNHPPTTNGTPESHTEREASKPAGLAALITETEALHETLADARARTARLIAALRRHRRHERLVSTTLASLKALRLQDVAE